ncbi:hypothetical protein SDJN02_13115 [Cucurbita argyrosperma subsp. argyrosperma]|nr:hypothetical protein SDJN02_13115 [Cucurbita argyrosperma subsp. argyrosperma]
MERNGQEKWRPEVIDCERLKISLQFRWGVKGRKGTAMGFPLVFAIALGIALKAYPSSVTSAS